VSPHMNLWPEHVLASNNNSTNRASRQLMRPLNTPIHWDPRPHWPLSCQHRCPDFCSLHGLALTFEAKWCTQLWLSIKYPTRLRWSRLACPVLPWPWYNACML
jgi:hypothetical protein